MSVFHIGTTRPTQWDYIVSTREAIWGNWPDIVYHVDYDFQWYAKQNGVSIAYNNSYYTFHDQQQKAATHISLNAGQYSGPVCAGVANFGWGNARSVSHSIGTSVSSWASGSGPVALPVLTIPEGTLSASLASYTHNSATINISYTSPNNYWYVRIWSADGTLLKDNCGNGANIITGLAPGTSYTFNVELWGRDLKMVIRRQLQFRTNGFSYLGGNVTNTLETPITFRAYTYSDSFITRVAIKYGSTVLCSVDRYSSGKVFDFSYTLTQSQLNAIYSSISNALSCQGTVTLTTYINGAASGTTSYAITFNVNQTTNKPMISSYAYLDTVQKAIDKTGNNQHVLQNVSILKIQNIVASAKNGANISKYRLTINGATFESSSTTIATNKVITSNSGIDLTVIDSRGLQYSYPHKNFVKFINYSKPVINECVLSRVNDVEESTRMKLKATFDRLAEKNIAIGIKYRYKATDSNTWSSYTSKIGTITNSTITYDNVIGNFDTGKSYEFEVVVIDYFYSVQSNQVLLKGQFELFVGDGVVEINGTLSMNDNPVKGVLGYKYGLGANINLNTLTQEGYYHQGSNSYTATSLNYPVAEAGLLTGINRGYIYQTYQTYNTSGFFYRSHYDGTWYSWRKVISGDSNIIAHMTAKGGYLGFDSATGGYLRTPTAGLLPNTSGVNGNIGTSSWRFAGGYFKNIDASGSVSSNTMYTSNWYRSSGQSGWYSESYGGGIYMKDSTYVRVYNAKAFWCDNVIYSRSNRCITTLVSNGKEGVDRIYFGNAERSQLNINAYDGGYYGVKIFVSDKRLKNNIRDTEINNALDKISQLEHVSFDWKQGGNHCRLGYVADDVEKVLPCLIFETKNGENEESDAIKNIDHTTLLPLITMGMQELIQENKYLWEFNNAVVEEVCLLKGRIDKLESLVTKLLEENGG